MTQDETASTACVPTQAPIPSEPGLQGEIPLTPFCAQKFTKYPAGISDFLYAYYSLCTECERYNSHYKNTVWECMSVRNQQSVANLNTIVHVGLLAVAVTTIAIPDNQSYWKLKTIKRTT